jgi:hypothetical protein
MRVEYYGRSLEAKRLPPLLPDTGRVRLRKKAMEGRIWTVQSPSYVAE